MLSVIANAYAESKEKINKIISALEKDNFVIALNGPSSIIIMEDVPDEEKKEEE